MKHLFFLIIAIFLISCSSNSVTVCDCLETKYSELTKMSEEEFDEKCDALAEKLGMKEFNKRAEKCQF
ncbi:MAG: hypothetical protein CMP68_02720 [Flavobacteriales bacterium]|nr:hypothetical protein [Flavobacteriales bacterium]|tara:strand:+ start:437 stop:640 length:204 start_codon:yes stop_codon:yes gene_type:complete